MNVNVFCMRVVFFDAIDVRMVLLLSSSKAHQINTKTIDRFDCYPGQAKLHALNATICGFLCVL